MIIPIILAALAATPPVRAGCADHWRIELDQKSFANNGAGKTFTAPRLAAFQTNVDATLKSVIGAACESGQVRNKDAKAVQLVTVLSASGATEPHLFPASDGSLAFEWIFAEEDLAMPPAKDIIVGAACWIDPKSGDCLAPGD